MTFAFEISAITPHGNINSACTNFNNESEVLRNLRRVYLNRTRQLENPDENIEATEARLIQLQQTIQNTLRTIETYGSMFVATATVLLSGEHHLPSSVFEEELDEDITMLIMNITFPPSPDAFMTYEESTDSFILYNPVISVQLASSVICPSSG